MEDNYPCPICFHLTDWKFECPGYKGTFNGKETILVCYPECSNAVEFYCLNKSCTWWYRIPNNRDAQFMGQAPDWLSAFQKSYSS